MTKTIERSENRQLDIEVATYVLSYTINEVKYDWYPYPVTLFHEENGFLKYRYDDNACNALPFRNGVDSSDGIPYALPTYSSDDSESMLYEVIQAMMKKDCCCIIRPAKGLTIAQDNRHQCTWVPTDRLGMFIGGFHVGCSCIHDSLAYAICKSAVECIKVYNL